MIIGNDGNSPKIVYGFVQRVPILYAEKGGSVVITKKMADGYFAITTCRVSTKKQEKDKANHSLGRQADSVIKAAERLNVTIPEDGQWSLHVSSKKGRNINRKDLAEMLAYCRQHKRVKYVIVDEPTRFMRSIDEAFYFEVVFKQIGVTVYYACDEMLNGDDPQAKLMRFMGYFKGESSNDERERIAFNGAAKAVRDGRWPGSAKLGYKKSAVSGVHRPIPVVGDLLKSLLTRVALGDLTPSQSLVEFNISDYVESGRHSRYRMDKWRRILTDPYYAGIISVTTARDGLMVNENGKHRPLITKHQLKMIEAIVFSKPKMRAMPRKGGNPKYRLNTFTYCKGCYGQEQASGKDEFHNLGKFVGYDNRNGKTDKVYERYGCRKCHRSLARSDLHEDVQACFNAVDFSEDGRKRFMKALDTAWEVEDQIAGSEIGRLNSELPLLNAGKSNLINALGRTTSQDVAAEIEEDIAEKVERIKDIEAQIEELKENKSRSRADFINWALHYVDQLAANFFDLPLEKVKVCKDLVFPNGFFIDENQRVYTPIISPIYRLKMKKQPLETTDFTHLVPQRGETLNNHNRKCQININGMVREESKTLHSSASSNCITNSGECLGANELKEIYAEIDRWYELLDVEYIRQRAATEPIAAASDGSISLPARCGRWQ